MQIFYFFTSKQPDFYNSFKRLSLQLTITAFCADKTEPFPQQRFDNHLVGAVKLLTLVFFINLTKKKREKRHFSEKLLVTKALV